MKSRSQEMQRQERSRQEQEFEKDNEDKKIRQKEMLKCQKREMKVEGM